MCLSGVESRISNEVTEYIDGRIGKVERENAELRLQVEQLQAEMTSLQQQTLKIERKGFKLQLGKIMW